MITLMFPYIGARLAILNPQVMAYYVGCSTRETYSLLVLHPIKVLQHLLRLHPVALLTTLDLMHGLSSLLIR